MSMEHDCMQSGDKWCTVSCIAGEVFEGGRGIMNGCTEFGLVLHGTFPVSPPPQALQEFIALCDREPTEAVTPVLHVWALMYNKLSTVRWTSVVQPCWLRPQHLLQ